MFTLPCELDSGLTGFSTDSSLVHEKESAHISSSKLPLSSSPEALWPSTAARISAGASRELRESSSSELSFALVSDTGLRDFPLWRGFFDRFHHLRHRLFGLLLYHRSNRRDQLSRSAAVNVS